MSVDKLRRISPSFEKACDRNRRDLLDPALFDARVEVGHRSFLMEVDEGCCLSVGSPYLLRLDGERIVLEIDGRSVGRDAAAPRAIIDAFERAGCPVTTGVVVSFDPVSGIADVALRARGEAA